MAQQYATAEEPYPRPIGGEGQERVGSGNQGTVGQYAESIPHATETSQSPAQTGQHVAQTGQQPQMGNQGIQQQRQRGVTASDMKLEEALTDEMRVALHDFVQSATACEWCADRCIDEGPEMAECIRLCRDVADLATLNIQLISRDSIFGREAAGLFATAAEVCAEECAQHSHRHCQECAEELSRAARSTRKMLASFDGGPSGTQIPGSQL